MLSFATPLASQIGFPIASLNKNNYKPIELELSQFTEYGMDGSLILLRNCLEQVNLHQGEVHNLPLKFASKSTTDDKSGSTLPHFPTGKIFAATLLIQSFS